MKPSLNIHYNYLINGELPLPSNFDWKNRKDPDSGCKKLYDDILLAYFDDLKQNNSNGIFSADVLEQKSYGQNSPFYYTIRINANSECIFLSSDYIGPSAYWAEKQGISNEKIVEFLSVCRTIGGHIVWPRGKDITYDGTLTINCAKGGEKGVYDRIDWTLLLIKIFYECQEKSEFFNKINSVFREEICRYSAKSNLDRMYHSIERIYAVWLRKFHKFGNFCDQFRLKGSFVDCDYNVIPMADWFPLLPNYHMCYIENLCKAIQNRNNIMAGKT